MRRIESIPVEWRCLYSQLQIPFQIRTPAPECACQSSDHRNIYKTARPNIMLKNKRPQSSQRIDSQSLISKFSQKEKTLMISSQKTPHTSSSQSRTSYNAITFKTTLQISLASRISLTPSLLSTCRG